MNDANLDDLPSIDFNRTCTKCGSSDWTGCNLDFESNTIIDCNRCPGKPLNVTPIYHEPGEAIQ